MNRFIHYSIIVAIIILLIPIIIMKGINLNIDYSDMNKTGEHSLQEADKSIDEILQEGKKIKVFIAEENKLSEMYLEDYVRGVVCAEMPAAFNIEALKAQAIAARTYAVTRMKANGGVGCNKDKDADICTDNTHCQEWVTKEERFKGWNLLEGHSFWEKVTKAVYETEGLILTHDSKPVLYPLYFSTSSGRTENSQEIFNYEEPYLQSVVSDYEEEAPKYLTKVSLSRDDFVRKLMQSSYKIQLNKSKLESQVKIIERTEGGSVKSIQLGTDTLSGTEVRGILNLNSANFSFEFNKNNVTIIVLGNGHGVGMSQWGANALGKMGNKYDEILGHYYLGTDIKKIDEAFIGK